VLVLGVGNPLMSDDGVGQRLRMMTLVANHLFLFVAGKLQVRELGDFCCASRPLREAAPPDPV
jgi:Ni,Fe-hydrogenase maturation factor